MHRSISNKILIVDIDRTLCPVDTLRILRHRWKLAHPLQWRRLEEWRAVSKQQEKIELWERVPFRCKPVMNTNVVQLMTTHAENGYEIALVSGSAQGLVDWFGAAVPVTPHHLAGSSLDINLTKSAKAQFVAERFSGMQTKYVGDSPDDYHVWQRTNEAIVVLNSTLDVRRVHEINDAVEQIQGPGLMSRVGAYLRLLFS